MTLIKRVTGQGITTSVNMELADLGIARRDPKRRANAVMFGDNFSFSWGQDWQSPSIVMYDNDFNVLGIPSNGAGIISQGNRRQLWPYGHNNPDYDTVLPCDFILVNGWWYVAVMLSKGPLDREGAQWMTEFWRSQDLIAWEGPILQLDHRPAGHHLGNTMLTFDDGHDGYIYIYGTGGLIRNKPIWMWRNKIDEFPMGWWEPWGMDHGGWAWGTANERTPILPGSYGELCFRHIQGQSVLSFFDVERYACSALTVVKPTDYWPGANRVDYAYGREHARLYGGYISPDSKLNRPSGMKFLVSQWGMGGNPYHVIRFDHTLQAKGPLVELPPTSEPEPEPMPDPEPTPDPKPDRPMTAEECYVLQVAELSASGSEPILTPYGEKLTLRQAVGETYDQECSLQNLGGKQLDPKMSACLLDHVLSARYEGLLTLDLVVALAKKLGMTKDEIGETLAKTRKVIG